MWGGSHRDALAAVGVLIVVYASQTPCEIL